MNPTILDGDLIYVNKLAYDLRIPLTLHRLAHWAEPERGDIVVCLSPEDGRRLVKRVVAKPGDTVEMRHNVLFLNGTPLAYSETDLDYGERVPEERSAGSRFAIEELDETAHPVMALPGVRAMRDFGPVTVPAGKYFLLGDNRDLSRDSRYFGLVGRESILGQARAVLLSFDITDKYQPRINRFFTGLE
jgi:signal peptidase I